MRWDAATRMRYFLCGSFALIFWLYAAPPIGHAFVERWVAAPEDWLEVRNVTIAPGQVVILDRDIKSLPGDPEGLFDPSGARCEAVSETCRPYRYFIGQVSVKLRKVLGTKEIYPVSCARAGREPLPYRAGIPYPAGGLKLEWFMNIPPDPECRLEDGVYVADFTWRRKWFGIPLEQTVSSQPFPVGKPPTGTGRP